tara:strand:+ start:22785 stop:26039 length:3255 start_codon:yes stop_codon:yes gene_type:complete
MKSIFPLKYCGFVCLFLMSQLMFAQLDDFNLSVATIDESCAGNGSISMEVSATTTNASLTYFLFLYPDLDTPIAQTSAAIFTNLESGNYLVQAMQTLGELQNSQSADATIINVITPLDFEVNEVFSGDCNTGSLLVSTLTGNAQSYEILSGPITTPLQTENTFNNLPQGTYVIRVFDDCNNALTKTFTLLLNNASFSIDVVAPPILLTNCNQTTITHLITAGSGSVLAYPITVNYTISLLDGTGTVSFSETISSGSETAIELTQTFNNYDDQVFQIEIIVEDLCGVTVSNIQQIDPNPQVVIIPTVGLCGNNINISVSSIFPPYTLEFTEFPDGFLATDYNANTDGVFNESEIVYGNQNTSMPYGIYSVSVTDACNRTSIATLELIEEEIEPLVSTANEGCDSLTGSLSVSIPNREIVSAIVIAAPMTYVNIIPDDISIFIIGNGALVVDELPKGDYVLELIDDCGSIYTVDFLIPDLVVLPINAVTSPNCTTDTGTLRIAGSYGQIETITITSAPPTFAFALPFNYSAAILPSGIFYVDNLPTGNYTIEFTDTCGNEFETNQIIESYTSNPSIFNLQINCGSFDIGIVDFDNSVSNQSYWLQIYNPVNDTWGNPITGVTYTEGDLPNASNAITIANGETIFNLFVTGTFRLIKAFQSVSNPNPNAFCLDIFAEFEVGSDLIINDVFNLNCDGGSGPSDVLVDVSGIPPYNFSIVSPVNIDNGTDNIFTNLSPGVYEIRVEDACGSIETEIINLLDLLPVVSINTPTDLVICNDVITSETVFDLSQQNSQLLGNQNPENLTITYHLTQNDADSGNNPIAVNYENISNPQTVFARMTHNTIDICYQTTSFQLIVGFAPQLGPDEFITVCDNNSVLLFAESGYSSYLWSTGESTRIISVNASGVYNVTVSNDYGNFSCDANKTYTVAVSGIANIDAIITEDFTANSNSVSIEVSGFGDYEYSLNGISYQLNNSFSDLVSGDYTVFVRDINECGIATKDFSLLDYRRFFTPNGDGDNEYWQILGSQFEPDLQVYIYNRYGKLLTGFTGNTIGWDGTFNGENMPSSDYWFVIERRNGKTHTGHFTLKR